MSSNSKFTKCVFCKISFDQCICKCSYCNQRDSCECGLSDFMTDG